MGNGIRRQRYVWLMANVSMIESADSSLDNGREAVFVIYVYCMVAKWWTIYEVYHLHRTYNQYVELCGGALSHNSYSLHFRFSFMKCCQHSAHPFVGFGFTGFFRNWAITSSSHVPLLTFTECFIAVLFTDTAPMPYRDNTRILTVRHTM